MIVLLSLFSHFHCSECECDPRGTLLSTGDPPVPLCDQLTGACQCKDNVGGDPCDICDVSEHFIVYYFNFMIYLHRMDTTV